MRSLEGKSTRLLPEQDLTALAPSATDPQGSHSLCKSQSLGADAVSSTEPSLSTSCVHCGAPVVLVDDLAPLERLGSLWTSEGMCARHWSNFAQGIAQSHGLTLLRSEEDESREAARRSRALESSYIDEQ